MGAFCYRSRDTSKTRSPGVCCSSNQGEAAAISFKLIDPQLIRQSVSSRRTIFSESPFKVCKRSLDTGPLASLFGFAFSAEDALFSLSRLSRSSHNFLRENYEEVASALSPIDPKELPFKLTERRIFREHEAGVNQIVWREEANEIISASHDFSIRVFNVQMSECVRTIKSETCNCLCLTGPKKDLLVAGFPNGDLSVYS